MQNRKEIVKRSFRSLTLLFNKLGKSNHILITNKQFFVLLGDCGIWSSKVSHQRVGPVQVPTKKFDPFGKTT